MFFSLNKKFIYTIAIFFIFTAVLFVYTFYIVYGSKIQEEQKSTILRNQQYLELLYENINLRKDLSRLIRAGHEDLFSKENLNVIRGNNNLEEKQAELSREQQRTAQIVQNYDERYQAITEGIRLVMASSFLIILSMLLIWYLMQRLVLAPINKLAAVSRLVSSGNYDSRVNMNDRRLFQDELDDLSHTFNQMLDNIQSSIRQIKNQETFLQSIIDGIPDGIRVIDKDGNISAEAKEQVSALLKSTFRPEFLNRLDEIVYYRQIGSSQNCIGQKCFASSQKRNGFCPPSTFTCPLREIMNKDAANVKVIQQFANEPGRHLAINAAPLYIDGRKTYIVEAIRDLSEDIRFSHQQKLSSLGFLATSVAHEMKNHLGSIRIIIEGLLTKFHNAPEDRSEEKKYLSLINDELNVCVDVPERLLKLAQFSSDTNQDIDCISGINDVLALLDYEAKHNGVNIEFRHPQSELHIRGSEGDFKMALINLIQNAFKAMPNGGNLKIEARRKRSEIEIKITDDGIGIPADKINRIFEPFYSEGSNSSRSSGTGLGLSIVKSIVENFRATIKVNSEEKKGTCFTLNFPLSPKK